MRMKWDRALRKPLAAGAICLVLAAQYVLAQNLGQNPQFNVAVQGQTGSQPEGAFLNFINWVGNVIAPVGAGGAVLGAIIAWLTGRGFGRWLFAAGALLAVSGVTRLIEFWITNGTGGVTDGVAQTCFLGLRLFGSNGNAHHNSDLFPYSRERRRHRTSSS
jgi:hypothetical protein